MVLLQEALFLGGHNCSEDMAEIDASTLQDLARGASDFDDLSQTQLQDQRKEEILYLLRRSRKSGNSDACGTLLAGLLLLFILFIIIIHYLYTKNPFSKT